MNITGQTCRDIATILFDSVRELKGTENGRNNVEDKSIEQKYFTHILSGIVGNVGRASDG